MNVTRARAIALPTGGVEPEVYEETRRDKAGAALARLAMHDDDVVLVRSKKRSNTRVSVW
jgi:hypothetical protein